VVLSALGFGSVVYGLSLIGAKDQPVSPSLLIPVGLLVLAVFVWRQIALQKGAGPLLDLRTLTHRTYALSLILMVVAFMGFLGALVLLPFYLQNARHLSILETGFLMMPGGLAMGLLGPQVGKLFDRYGGRPLVIPGSLGILVALAMFSRVGLSTPYWLILGMHMLLMVSLAAVFTPVFTLGLGAVPRQLYSHASSLLGALQQVAGAAGAAVSAAVMSTRQATLLAGGSSNEAALTGGMQKAFVVSAALSVIVVVMAVALPGRLPAPQDDAWEVDGDLDDGVVEQVPAV
jgi:DHA2 family lincomycin resistance protein-like MFS transporter